MRLLLISSLLAAIFYLGESVENYQTLKARVRAYLEEHPDDWVPSAINVRKSGQPWLENSHKIGYGYNPLIGSPVCYTDDCQIDGFRRPIFKLTHNTTNQGACTDKYFPDQIDLDCLPLTISNPITEEIGTIAELKTTVSNGIEIKPSSFEWDTLSARSFSYGYSKEITRMLDTIIKDEMKIYFTSVKVNFAKLSLFEPTAELSDNFIYVIRNMPCCDASYSDMRDYILNFIIDYFGFAYIPEIILGGRIQNLVTVKSKEIDVLKFVGIKAKEEANIRFIMQSNMKITLDSSKTRQDLFAQQIQSEYSARLGGDPSVRDIYEWMKTVPENPAITKFSMKYIVDLLKPNRFPDDPLIIRKAKLIEDILKEYSRQVVFCYNNCSGIDHGMCIATGAFRMGLCYCHSNFTGTTCSEPIGRLLPQGIVCGYHGPGNSTVATITSIPCDDKHLPFDWQVGYTPVNTMLSSQRNPLQTVHVGYKMQTSYTHSPSGTFCGHGTVVRCGDKFPKQGCPIGYNYSAEWNACWKKDSTTEDLSGTQCGLWVNHPIRNLTFPCAPRFENDQECPANYRRMKWQVFDASIEQCFKI